MAVDLAHRRIEVHRQLLCARTGTGGPGSAQQGLGDAVELANVAEGERPQERAQGRGRHHPMPEDLLGAPRPEDIGVIDRVATGHHRVQQGQHLTAGPVRTGSVAEVDQLIDHGLHAQPFSQRGGQCQAGVGHGTAAQRQGPQPGERAGQLGRPGPGALQAQDHAAGVADDAGGDVQQPVAQRLGLGHGERAVQQQRLGPAGEVLGGQDQLQPDGVAAPPVERQVAQPGGLGGADAVLDPGALAVAQLQPARSGSGWSVRKTWKRWPSWSVKRSWAPGWASSRRQIARVPAGQVCRSIQPVSSHTSAPWRAWPSASTAGVQAGSGWARIASRTWASIGMPSENPTWSSRRCQASRVLAPALSLRTSTGWSVRPRELGQGEVDQLDQVIGGAGGGVARPQQAGQRLPGRLAAVQVGQQRVEPEGVLVGARRALLGVAVGQHQGRVGVDDQQLERRGGRRRPRRGRGHGPGRPAAGPARRVAGRALDHPPGGRGRGHRAEQLRLVAQHRQVAQAVAAIGQHHRQIPQHRRVRMPAPAPPGASPAPWSARPGRPAPAAAPPRHGRPPRCRRW